LLWRAALMLETYVSVESEFRTGARSKTMMCWLAARSLPRSGWNVRDGDTLTNALGRFWRYSARG
jgi:hypothetical protein